MAGFNFLSGDQDRPVLRRGLRVDHLGDERLVLDPAGGVVHTVRGPAVKALDEILGGRSAVDDELVVALTGAGIVEIRGVSRREALQLSGTAALMVTSAALPVAAAAASTGGVQISGTGGVVSDFTVTSGENTFDLIRVAHDSAATSSGDITRILTLGSAAEVSVLLVGGGGGGGVIGSGDLLNATGGGGAGEVHEVSLGSLAGGTALTVLVGGRASVASNGRATTVSIASTVVAQAKGGGRGAGTSGASRSGGSGGGGSSYVDEFEDFTSGAAAGSSGAIGPSATDGAIGSLVFAGGDGVASGAGAGAGGGGGGADALGATGSGEVGGNGGGATDINAFFGTYSTDSSPYPGEYRYVAAGGGGGGLTTGGSGGDGGDSIVIGGNGSTPSGLATSPDGAFATGSGGGGGAASANFAYGGQGGSGVAWIRIKVA